MSMSVTRIKKRKDYRCPCGHVGIFVKDLKKVSRFYTAKLGFKLQKEFVAEKKMIKKLFGINDCALIRYLERDGFGIELIYFSGLEARKKNTSGSHHWTILVNDKDRFCKNLRRKSVRVIAFQRPHDFVYFIEDPEKNLIEVKNNTP